MIPATNPSRKQFALGDIPGQSCVDGKPKNFLAGVFAWQLAEIRDFRLAIFQLGIFSSARLHAGPDTWLAANQFPSDYNFRGFGVFASEYPTAYTGQLHNKIAPRVWQEKRGGTRNSWRKKFPRQRGRFQKGKRKKEKG